MVTAFNKGQEAKPCNCIKLFKKNKYKYMKNVETSTQIT